MPTCSLCWIPAQIRNIHEQIWWTENKLLNNICLCNKTTMYQTKQICIKNTNKSSWINAEIYFCIKFTNYVSKVSNVFMYQNVKSVIQGNKVFPHVQIQRRGRGSGRPPEKSQKYRVHRNTVVRNPRKITKLQSHWRFAGGQMMAHF